MNTNKINIGSEFSENEAVEDNRTEEELENDQNPNVQSSDANALFEEMHADKCDWCVRDRLQQLRKKEKGSNYCTMHNRRLNNKIIQDSRELKRKQKRVYEYNACVKEAAALADQAKRMRLYNDSQLGDVVSALLKIEAIGVDCSHTRDYLGLPSVTIANPAPLVPSVGTFPRMPKVTPLTRRPKTTAPKHNSVANTLPDPSRGKPSATITTTTTSQSSHSSFGSSEKPIPVDRASDKPNPQFSDAEIDEMALE